MEFDLDDDIDFSTNDSDEHDNKNIYKKFKGKLTSKETKDMQDVKDSVMKLKVENQVNTRIKYIQDITELPKKNEQIRFITVRSFDAITILTWILQHEEVKECYLATYSIGKYAGKYLQELLKDKKLGKCTILISSIRNTSMKGKKAFVEYLADEKLCKLIYATNHAKVIAIKTANNYYIVEGSGNFNNNSRIEQYLLENRKESFDFHKKWITEIETVLKNNDFKKYN